MYKKVEDLEVGDIFSPIIENFTDTVFEYTGQRAIGGKMATVFGKYDGFPMSINLPLERKVTVFRNEVEIRGRLKKTA